MGPTGHGSGTDVLLLQEHAHESAQWNASGAATTGGYNASAIRNNDLKSLYENQFQWAHSYAIKPGTTDPGTWDIAGGGSDFWRLTNELTTSTGNAVNADTINGAFLLSSADVVNTGFGFPSSQGNNASRVARTLSVVDPGTGTASRWWSRSPAVATTVYVSDVNGNCNTTNGISQSDALRPALLLNLK